MTFYFGSFQGVIFVPVMSLRIFILILPCKFFAAQLCRIVVPKPGELSFDKVCINHSHYLVKSISYQ